MRIYIDITNCAQCPYFARSASQKVLYCNKVVKQIGEISSLEQVLPIPTWCPFNKQEEENEAIRQQLIYDALIRKGDNK